MTELSIPPAALLCSYNSQLSQGESSKETQRCSLVDSTEAFRPNWKCTETFPLLFLMRTSNVSMCLGSRRRTLPAGLWDTALFCWSLRPGTRRLVRGTPPGAHVSALALGSGLALACCVRNKDIAALALRAQPSHLPLLTKVNAQPLKPCNHFVSKRSEQ